MSTREPDEATGAAVRLGGRPFWAITLYPEASEGGGCLHGSRRETGVNGGPSRDRDPDRAAAEALRRARAKIRRYCAANRLNRLGTLTYADACRDQDALRRDVASFFKGLRRGLGGRPLPYLWVAEEHPGGHGLHAHFAVARFVKRSLIENAWGRGHVHIKLTDGLRIARRSAR
jgi:hypothetical protein